MNSLARREKTKTKVPTPAFHTHSQVPEVRAHFHSLVPLPWPRTNPRFSISAFLSGAHMNPAVTLAFAVVRRLDWIKVPVYWISQLLGAFIASAVVYGIYSGRSSS